VNFYWVYLLDLLLLLYTTIFIYFINICGVISFIINRLLLPVIFSLLIKIITYLILKILYYKNILLLN
jgi:hypothetical protein